MGTFMTSVRDGLSRINYWDTVKAIISTVDFKRIRNREVSAVGSTRLTSTPSETSLESTPPSNGAEVEDDDGASRKRKRDELSDQMSHIEIDCEHDDDDDEVSL